MNTLNKKNTVLICLFMLMSVPVCQTILAPGGNAKPPMEVYLGLREIWFTTSPDSMGIEFEPDSKTPYAVLMDIGSGEDTVTIVSSILGDGILYTSTGGE
jgi:hypothetical protein